VGIGRDVDSRGSESGSSDGEIVEEEVRMPRGRAQPPIAVPPLAIDPGVWLNMVNVGAPISCLIIESMKKLFWSINVIQPIWLKN